VCVCVCVCVCVPAGLHLIEVRGIARTCICMCTHDIGWRRLIGCLELQIIFCKRATNHRGLLWKVTCEDKASYGSSPPCRYSIYIVSSVNMCECWEGMSK